MTSIENLIIEMMPFPRELKDYCKSDPDFAKALKIIYHDRFIALQAVATSYSPNFPKDEVIGIYVYDYGAKTPRFKQDFIVNIGKKNESFILYTGLVEVVDNKKVKHINEFIATYGKGGHYEGAHWSKFDEFSDKLKERALKAIALAEKRKKAGFVTINQEHVDEIYKRLQQIK